MSVTIVSVPGCQQCKTAKMMLTKRKMKYEEIFHSEMFHDDYPIIYIDNNRYNYRDFLIYMKEVKNE